MKQQLTKILEVMLEAMEGGLYSLEVSEVSEVCHGYIFSGG